MYLGIEGKDKETPRIRGLAIYDTKGYILHKSTDQFFEVFEENHHPKLRT
jgi:hypothetical protein